MLWTTRKPSNTDTVPSSIATGMETSTVFLHSPRTRIEVRVDAERLPHACELRARELVRVLAEMGRRLGRAHRVFRASRTTKRTVAQLPQAKGDVDARRRAAAHRRADDPDDVLAAGQARPRRAAAGETERVAARQHVAEPRKAARHVARRGTARRRAARGAGAAAAPACRRRGRRRTRARPGACRSRGTTATDRRTRLTTGSRVTGTATLHGIRSRGPRWTDARTAPVSAPGAAGRTAASTVIDDGARLARREHDTVAARRHRHSGRGRPAAQPDDERPDARRCAA